jgi:hypothetical protein
MKNLKLTLDKVIEKIMDKNNKLKNPNYTEEVKYRKGENKDAIKQPKND